MASKDPCAYVRSVRYTFRVASYPSERGSQEVGFTRQNSPSDLSSSERRDWVRTASGSNSDGSERLGAFTFEADTPVGASVDCDGWFSADPLSGQRTLRPGAQLGGSRGSDYFRRS